ncbi:MAG: protease modulator HflC [Armatimonadetes bacterium]|nr:protease modulator HflC [Planctomycetota bacterium]MBI2200567.1 protease modulator HflC [Armatimonadota bacterium]
MQPKGNLFSILSGVIVAAGLLLYLLTFTVRENEFAVVSTFRKPAPAIDRPGLYWKLPWPIQDVARFDRSIQILDGTFEETYTTDGKNIILMAYVAWRIQDPLLFRAKTGGEAAQAEALLKNLVQSYKNGVLGQHPLKHLVSTEPKDIQFEAMEREILEPVQREAIGSGIEVLQIGIKRLALPESTTATVFEKMRAERLAVAESYRLEGETQANRIRAEARRQAEDILNEAKASAMALRAKADAEAAPHYRALQEEPALAQFLQELQSLKTITAEGDVTFVLTTDMPPFSLLEQGPPKSEDAASRPEIRPEP